MQDLYVWILTKLFNKELKLLANDDVSDLQYKFSVTKNGVLMKLRECSEKNKVNIQNILDIWIFN